MEDMISALPNDLLVKILLHVSTKDAAATMILSKRWRFVWTMVPKLEYIDDADDQRERDSACRFLDKSLELHKESVLDTLSIYIKGSLSIDVDVDFGKWIANAVDRYVRVLEFELLKSRKLTNLPNSLYTCKTLVKLTLSHNIYVDVPSSACLPSLKNLTLSMVVYKDEDSLLRLLSSCSVLAQSNISFFISDCFIDSPSIKNFAHTKDQPSILILCRANYKILRSLSLAVTLILCLMSPMAMDLSGITFSQLQWLRLLTGADGWSNLLLLILKNSPKLWCLHINSVRGYRPGELPLSTNQPSTSVVPRCLSSQLELFEWEGFRGSEEEKKLMRYILANSECLKSATITLTSLIFDPKEKDNVERELKSMSRVSKRSRLIFK